VTGSSEKFSEKRRRFLGRLEGIETRLARLIEPVPDLCLLQAKLAGWQDDLEAMRSQLAVLDSGIAGLTNQAASVDIGVRDCLRRDLEKTLPVIESKIQSLIARQQAAMEALPAGRPSVTARVSNLENEVAGQRAALIELQECSLRTERTMQKLLKGIDRLL
jgi:hypothetical protein